MKRTVLRVVSGLLLLLIIFGALLEAGKLVIQDIVWDSFYATEKNTIDVGLIGSSGIMRYFQEAQAYGEQGFTSYVLASSALPLKMLPTIMDEFMRRQDPELFVVDIRTVIYDETAAEKADDDKPDAEYLPIKNLISLMDPLSPYRWRSIFRFAKGVSLSNFVESCFPILNYPSLVYLDDEKIKQKHFDYEWDNYYGFAVHTSTTDYTELGEMQKQLRNDGKSHLDDSKKAVIDELYNKAKEYNKQVFFIITPYLKDDAQYTVQEETRTYMTEKGYDYLDCQDFFDDIGLDYSRDFYDKRHVNVIGAHKFTSWFAEYLNEHFSLLKNHSAATKEKWDRLSAEWSVIYPECRQRAENEVYDIDLKTGEITPKKR